MTTINNFFYSWHDAFTKALKEKMPALASQPFVDALMDEFEMESDSKNFDSENSDYVDFSENSLPKLIKLVIEQEGADWPTEQQNLVQQLAEQTISDRVLDLTFETKEEKALRDLPDKLAERAIIFEDPRTKPGRGNRS